MKKINIFLLSFLVLAVSMMSCSKQLEEKVYSELLVNTAYETEEDAEVLILAAYSALRGNDWGTYYEYDYLMVSESGTDTYGMDGWEAGNQKAEMGTWDNQYSFIINLWDGAYKVIAAASLQFFAFRLALALIPNAAPLLALPGVVASPSLEAASVKSAIHCATISVRGLKGKLPLLSPVFKIASSKLKPTS